MVQYQLALITGSCELGLLSDQVLGDTIKVSLLEELTHIVGEHKSG